MDCALSSTVDFVRLKIMSNRSTRGNMFPVSHSILNIELIQVTHFPHCSEKSHRGGPPAPGSAADRGAEAAGEQCFRQHPEDPRAHCSDQECRQQGT